jgi:hypothetical protein
MSYSFPKFKSGNTNFANALNAVVAAAKKHGVNPGGRPGWAETENGWLPPNIFSESTGSFRWDLKRAPDLDDQWILLNPSVTFSREDIEQEVTITNNPFTVDGGYWVVAKLQGPIDTFLETPTITIESVDTWDGFPSAYKFGADPFEWQVTRIPIHRVEALAEEADKKDAISVGEGIYATKLIGPYPTLAFTLATVPNQSKTRVVPTFL